METKERLRIADEVWIATALLHRENPEAADFSIDQIVARVARLNGAEELRPGVYVHAVQHCVANRPPNPGRYCMLFESSAGRRRLFRKGDAFHPAREGAKITPEPENIPVPHQKLLLWYREWSEQAAAGTAKSDPLLRLKGSGKKLWADEPADVYVERLREGWQ